MARRGITRCLFVLGACLWAGRVAADDSHPTSEATPATARTGIRVLVLGERGQELQPELEALINSELRDENAQLNFERQAGKVRSWVEQARRDDRALLLAVVDTRQDQSWRVYIVDAERGRAAARTLPGGMEQDQAAVEAVASIVVSATAALHEGLEVASQSVEDVVAPEEAEPRPSQKASPPERAPRAPSKPAAPAKHEGSGAPGTPADGVGYRFRAALLASAATFAEPEPFSYGARVSLGVSTPAGLAFRIGAGRHLPVTIASDFGRFDVDKSTLDLSAGYLFEFSRFEVEPEASGVGELLQRRSAQAEETATAQGERSYTRVGGLLGVRARYRGFGPVALELGAGASYFPRTVRFVSAPEMSEIAQLWKFVPRVELGVELRVP